MGTEDSDMEEKMSGQVKSEMNNNLDTSKVPKLPKLVDNSLSATVLSKLLGSLAAIFFFFLKLVFDSLQSRFIKESDEKVDSLEVKFEELGNDFNAFKILKSNEMEKMQADFDEVNEKMKIEEMKMEEEKGEKTQAELDEALEVIKIERKKGDETQAELEEVKRMMKVEEEI